MEQTQDPTIERLQGRLSIAVECLRDLASHIEWEEDTRPVLDRDGLDLTWDRVERVLEQHADEPATATVWPEPPGSLERVFWGARQRLRSVQGLDLGRPITEVEREAWARELALGGLISVGQLFDRIASLCLEGEELIRWRRRKALNVLVTALKLALLHGVTESALISELALVEEPAPCPSCHDTRRVTTRSKYLGAPDVGAPCPRCGDGR